MFFLFTGITLNMIRQPIIGTAIVIIGFAPIVYYLDRFLFPSLLIGPLSFAYLFHLFGYAIAPAWQYYVLGYFEASKDGFVLAQWGAVLGLSILVITFPIFYKIGSSLGKKEDLQVNPSERSKWEGFTFLLLGIMAITILTGFTSGILNRLSGGIAGSQLLSSFLNFLSPIILIVFFFLGYFAKTRGLAWLMIWLTVFLLYSIFSILDGSRGGVAYAALISALGIFYAGYPRYKLIFWGTLFLIIFIPLSGIVLEYRGNYSYQYDPTNLELRLDGFTNSMENFFEQISDNKELTEAFTGALMAKSVDRVFILTPNNIPYAKLDGIANIKYIFVPQVINSNRPAILDGNDLSILYGAANPGSKGAYMPTVGDGYRRFGWPGIVLLYLISSFIFAIFIGIAWKRRESRLWLAFLVFLLIQSLNLWTNTLMTNFYYLFWVFPRTLLTFSLLVYFHEFLIFLLSRRHRSINSFQAKYDRPWRFHSEE
jgi:hypothetical protein